MTDLVIIGTTPLAREVARGVGRINEERGATFNLLGFTDEEKTGELMGYPILGKLEDFLKMDRKVQFFVADMDGYVRERIAKTCKEAGFTAATVILGSLAKIDPGVEIGEGCYIGGGAYKRNVKIGEHCIIQGGGVFGRGAEVGAFTSIMTSPVVGRNAKIGRKNYFGLRCNVADGVSTTDECTFGACATVLEDAKVPGMYAGAPAVLKKPLNK